MTFPTPIAFFIFNRPDLTKTVFEEIRKIQPQQLFVIADGARSAEEVERCDQARSIIQQIDWKCEVRTNFSEVNLGCKHRISSGLDWVFSEVEEAIILEDDCLPNPSFFNFCQTLLEKYRYDRRIMMISGDNFQNGKNATRYSYYFSKYAHVWGWATWRRAWQHYDVKLATWREAQALDLICSICENSAEQRYWTNIFDRVFKGEIDTWDYQWLYTCWSQHGLSILPNVNLISNIGFRADATHVSSHSPWANLPTIEIEAIHHPPIIVRNCNADEHTFDHHYNGCELRETRYLAHFKRKLKQSMNIIRKS
jgi:hypothetical protein